MPQDPKLAAALKVIAAATGNKKEAALFTKQVFRFRDGTIGASVKIKGATRYSGTVNIEQALLILKHFEEFIGVTQEAAKMLSDPKAIEAYDAAQAEKETKKAQGKARKKQDEANEAADVSMDAVKAALANLGM